MFVFQCLGSCVTQLLLGQT